MTVTAIASVRTRVTIIITTIIVIVTAMVIIRKRMTGTHARGARGGGSLTDSDCQRLTETDSDCPRAR